ncbi:ABC transporter substrate-binding protein [Hutsoniella sourekii]
MKKLIQLILVIALSLGLIPASAARAEAPKPLKAAIVTFVSHPSLDTIVQGIHEGLEEAGYKEGDNLTTDFYNANGDINLLSSIADQAIEGKPDIIYAVTTPVALAFQAAKTDIPVVFTGVTDPLGAGLVDSLEEPGANLYGVSNYVSLDQQFELVKKLTPDAKKVGFLYTTSEDSALSEVEEASEVAKKYGLDSEIAGISSTNEMQMVAEDLASKVDVIYVGSDNLIAAAFDSLLDATDKAQVPVYSSVKLMIGQGALAGAAIEEISLGHLAVKFGEEVLAGDDIAKKPVQFIDDLTVIVNQETADRLAIKVPEGLAEVTVNTNN